MATLIVEQGTRRTRIPLVARTSIGSAASNRLVIQDSSVLPTHACIYVSAGERLVDDLTGGKETLVNGLTVRGRHALRDGDLIRIGSAKLIFSADTDSEASLP